MALIDNLISYWALNEASGNAVDAHGSNTLTDTNTVGSATGKVGNARDFESSADEYFTVADNAGLSTGDVDFTIAAWVNLESIAANMTIVGRWLPTGNQREYWLRLTAAAFQFAVATNGTGESASVSASNFGSPSTGTWCHVVAWHDSVNNQIGISVNAGTANTASHAGGVFDSTAAFQIGDIQTNGFNFDGLIDEVGFWKRVLTSGERTQLYNGGAGLAYPFASGAVIRLVNGGLVNFGLTRGGLVHAA